MIRLGLWRVSQPGNPRHHAPVKPAEMLRAPPSGWILAPSLVDHPRNLTIFVEIDDQDRLDHLTPASQHSKEAMTEVG
jgi:hypothetical protein